LELMREKSFVIITKLSKDIYRASSSVRIAEILLIQLTILPSISLLQLANKLGYKVSLDLKEVPNSIKKIESLLKPRKLMIKQLKNDLARARDAGNTNKDKISRQDFANTLAVLGKFQGHALP